MLCGIMDFDNEFLIMIIQGFDCLYNPKCKEYNSRQARNEAWGGVCKVIMGDSWEELSRKEKQRFGEKVQTRWKCLKDAYNRSLRTRVERRERDGKSGRPYVYEQQMSFLKSCLRSKAASDSPDMDVDVNSCHIEEIIVNIDPSEPEHSNTASTTPKPSSGACVKRRRTLALKTSESSSSTSASVPPLPVHHNEGDKMFLLSLLPTMQDMSAVEKIDFKIKVMHLLKDNMESRERRKSSKSETVSLMSVPGEAGEV